MDEKEKELLVSPPEEQPKTEPGKESEGDIKPKEKPSTVPYYRLKEKVDQYNSLFAEFEQTKAEMKKYEGMDINKLRELDKLQQDLGNPELLAGMKEYVSDFHAKKRTPTNTTIKPDAKIVDLERRVEQFEIDKLSARIEGNLGKLEQEFGKFDKEKLLTLVEEDGYNPTSYKHVKACFKEYFSDDISAKKKSDLEQKIKNLPEGGGSGGKPADTTPDNIGDIFRLKKAGKL